MPNLKRIYYTAKRTGIRMSLQAWLEAIASKDFNLEYCMMNTIQQFEVNRTFVNRVRNGYFVEA